MSLFRSPSRDLSSFQNYFVSRKQEQLIFFCLFCVLRTVNNNFLKIQLFHNAQFMEHYEKDQYICHYLRKIFDDYYVWRSIIEPQEGPRKTCQ